MMEPAPGPKISEGRIASLDILRGIIMILMTLDHVRDFFSNARFSPLDLAYTVPALFLTRWITHICAPGFVFLAGISAYLWAASHGRSRFHLAGFLLWRGLLLIVLEFTVIRFAWFLDLNYEVSLAQVIWVIGVSMAILAGLVFLPDWMILTIAIILIGGHNILDCFPMAGILGADGWSVLHRPGYIPLGAERELYILYPLLPWPGVMALGYSFGRLYRLDVSRRSRVFTRFGGLLLAFFVALRILNIYGDPARWYPQRKGVLTLLSFINVEKYPPSLLFLLLTLGMILILLGFLERLSPSFLRFTAIYGRVPLFYYVAHLYVIHLLAVGLAYLRYGRADWLIGSAWFFREGYPPDYGFGLPGVYLIWILIVAALFPLVKLITALKQRHAGGWLSYF